MIQPPHVVCYEVTKLDLKYRWIIELMNDSASSRRLLRDDEVERTKNLNKSNGNADKTLSELSITTNR